MRQVYPKGRREPNRHLDRRWHVHYSHMVYDGGGHASWVQGYRTYLGARLDAWRNEYWASWGGEVHIEDTRERA